MADLTRVVDVMARAEWERFRRGHTELNTQTWENSDPILKLKIREHCAPIATALQDAGMLKYES